MIRGLLAILAGTGVLFIPEMASTILLLPFAIATSILCLAAYGTIDSAIVFTTSFPIPRTVLAARGISVHHGTKWCYASAFVAAFSAIALLFGTNLNPRELAWLIYGCLAVLVSIYSLYLRACSLPSRSCFIPAKAVPEPKTVAIALG